MARRADNGSFWLSYSDLMTSMFFIMLVLFIVCVVKMSIANNELRTITAEATGRAEAAENILHLSEQFEELSRSTCLAYDEAKRTFYTRELQDTSIFESKKAEILQQHLHKVQRVGRDIETILRRLNERNPDFRYQLVVEGNAAIPFDDREAGRYNPDNEEMYLLSYRRAMALYTEWRRQSIDLRRYNTEILIAGSGFNGINRDHGWEDNNKRFVIQIIPKVARPDSAGIRSVPTVESR